MSYTRPRSLIFSHHFDKGSNLFLLVINQILVLFKICSSPISKSSLKVDKYPFNFSLCSIPFMPFSSRKIPQKFSISAIVNDSKVKMTMLWNVDMIGVGGDIENPSKFLVKAKPPLQKILFFRKVEIPPARKERSVFAHTFLRCFIMHAQSRNLKIE